jgi:alkylation response protein AidB-like acyl-CoA dehydrogenase
VTQDLSELHGELAQVARDLLGKAPAPEWSALASAGWLGLEVGEGLGGAGASFAETAVILEEMGRAATSSPFLGTAVLAAGALNRVEANAERDDLLQRIAAGGALVAVAVPTDDDLSGVSFTLDAEGTLRGGAAFVPDAAGAERILALADDGSGVVLVDIDAHADGLTVQPQPVVDATRRLAAVVAGGVRLDGRATWKLNGGPGAITDRGALAIACDSLGLAEAMLEATVDYVQVRQQFGRPIGSFQAVKHACADMLVEVQVSKQLVGAAVKSVAGELPESAAAVSMAKSYACEAAVKVAGKAMQLHGGIGYTWEKGIHVYLKRAVLNRVLFGSPAAHRRRLAASYSARAAFRL